MPVPAARWGTILALRRSPSSSSSVPPPLPLLGCSSRRGCLKITEVRVYLYLWRHNRLWCGFFYCTMCLARLNSTQLTVLRCTLPSIFHLATGQSSILLLALDLYSYQCGIRPHQTASVTAIPINCTIGSILCFPLHLLLQFEITFSRMYSVLNDFRDVAVKSFQVVNDVA